MQGQPPGGAAMRGSGTAVVTPATVPDHALGVVWWPPASMICEREGHG
jgi:hypothetical protein